MKGRRIFVVEDDRKIAELVADYLTSHGHEPTIFPDARRVVDEARRDAPAAFILDVMLPAGNGVELCRQLREFCPAPILMLTARVEERDKLTSLDIGADDYVTKPFSPQEVVARTNALIRRAEGRMTRNPEAQAWLVDEEGQRIAWAGDWLDLSPSEYRLLGAMMKHPGRVWSRAQLLDQLGEHALESGYRAIDSHVKNIRRKLAAVGSATDGGVASVYGSGYRFDPPKGDGLVGSGHSEGVTGRVGRQHRDLHPPVAARLHRQCGFG